MSNIKLVEQQRKLTFFTDITTTFSNFCLLNVNFYNDKRKKLKFFNRIDPSVYELKESDEYSNIDFLHSLIQEKLLLENEDISIDYPSDMNIKYSELFIQKTNENIKKYYQNKHYIISPQYLFHDFDSFVEQFNKNKQYFLLENKILGLGNLCRILYCDKYTDKIFEFLFNNLPIEQKIHFYGLGMRLIKRYLPKMIQKFQISIDSTKFTRAVSNELKLHFGLNSNSKNRNIFFLGYINELEKICNVIF